MRFLTVISILLAAVAQATVAGETKAVKGDTLLITIKGVPQEEQAQVNGHYVVTKEGNLLLPYLAKSPIKVAGKEPRAIAKIIDSAYKEARIFTQPVLTVIHLSGHTHIGCGKTVRFLTVSGQVGRPGPQPYRPGLRLIDVVSQAGPSTFAAQNRVELLRNGKVYKYNMKIPAHMVEKVYPNDQITLKEKNIISK